jgi:hypothetical protein
MARKNRKKKTRTQKMSGGSMLNPPERQEYVLGSVVKGLSKGATALIKKVTKSLPKKEVDRVIKQAEDKIKREAAVTPERRANRIMLGDEDPGGYTGQRGIDIEYAEHLLTEDKGRGLPEETILFNIKELHKIRDEFNDLDQYNIYLDELVEQKQNFENSFADAQFKRQQEGEAAAETAAYKEFEPDDIDPDDLPPPTGPMAEGFDDTPTGRWEGEMVGDPPTFMKTSGREPRQAGGSMLVPPEMEGAPVDTYPNIPPEEMAEVKASQLPDEEMESDYVDFVMNEALEQEEQMYLMNALEADPQLSMIFDKVVDTASEFSGAGEVSGPGDGVSDSIPARLSDGEFVMTKKATDQIGADNLQVMMDDAERAYDGGLMRKDEEDDYRSNINKTMLSANQMPSLNVRQR